MQLYTVLAGISKKRMKPIMIDELHKCQNYVDARNKSPTKVKWFDIVPAPKDAKPWKKQNSMTKAWAAYNDYRVPRVK